MKFSGGKDPPIHIYKNILIQAKIETIFTL